MGFVINQIDTDLVSSNIRNWVDVFWVTGDVQSFAYGDLGTYIGSLGTEVTDQHYSALNTRTIELSGKLYMVCFWQITASGANTRWGSFIVWKLDITSWEIIFIWDVSIQTASSGSVANIVSSYVDWTDIYINITWSSWSWYCKIDTLTDVVTWVTGSTYTTGTLDNSTYYISWNTSYDWVSIISKTAFSGWPWASLVGKSEVHQINFEPNTNTLAVNANTFWNLNWKPDWLSVYVNDSSNHRQYNLSTPFDLSTATLFGSFLNLNSPTSTFLWNAWTRLYYWNPGNNQIERRSLSSAYNITTTGTANQTYTATEVTWNVKDLHFRDNGLKMYLLDSDTDRIYQYTLWTAWTINSGVTYDSIAFASWINAWRDKINTFGLNATGDKLVLTLESNKLFTYTLSTPFDLSTATLDDGYTNMNLFENYNTVYSSKYTTWDEIYVVANNKIIWTDLV